MNIIINSFLEIFKNPVFFIGIITFIGCLFSDSNFTKKISSTIKAMIGMIILSLGVEAIIKAVTPLSESLKTLFNYTSTVPLADFNTFLNKHGSFIVLIMFIGFILNIILARYTKLKTVYLTGNILFWYPMIFLAVGMENKLDGFTLFFFALILYMCVITILPNIIKNHMKYVCGETTFTIGHTSSIFCLIGSYIGKFIGDKENSAENLNLPKSLDFLKDVNIVSSIIISIIYILVSFFVDTKTSNLLFGNSPIIFSITQGITFAAGMVILLLGVRMIFSEIIPSFSNLSSKLCPNSIPALDIPMIFPYGKTSLMIGFIISLITTISLTTLLSSMNLLAVPLLPMVIACYFDVAPCAIFANARGGLKAAIISSIVSSIILVLLLNVSICLVQNTVGNFIQIYGGNEFSIWVVISDFIANLISAIT